MILSGARADVEMVSGSCREVVRGIPEQVLIGVHLEQLLLQGSLHLNRSRALAQLGQQPEAAQELSVTMALWAAHGAAGRSMGQEATEQLIKAHYLRAKTRILRQRPEPARADLRSAWALGPAPGTAALLRQAEREVDVMEKEKLRSNKKLAKEIAKLADTAMAGG